MKRLILIASGIWAFSAFEANSQNTVLPYQDSKRPIEERVNDLLGRMTLEEKIGQMTQISTSEINNVVNPKAKADRFRPYLDKEKAAKFVKENHVGSFLAAFAVSPKDWFEFSMQLQKTNLENSRLKIPIIYGNDHIHGANYVSGATWFPQAINLANTFNEKLAAEMGRITAMEISDLGQHWNFAPVLDVGRNPIWPRQYETMGEDPYLISKLGSAYIQSLQSAKEALPYKIAATAKHFIGYSDPKTGWDRVPAVIPDQELREIFLPPFKAAIQAGVKSFMVNSGEVNGVPVHASSKLLNDLLRKELGFDGLIVTDWADILQLIGEHKMARNEKEATLMSLKAGVDMSMTASSVSFCKVTKQLVDEGLYPIERIDASVKRILRLKFDLGLFENPFPSDKRFSRIGSLENKAQARIAAEESIVLLKNEGNILPIASGKKILVGGANANSRTNLCGGWTIEWGGAAENKYPNEMETVFSALQKEYKSGVTLFQDTIAKGLPDLGKWSTACNTADIIVCVVGETPYAEGLGNINDLTLPEEQIAFVKAAQNTGKPVLLVMVAGRPRIIASVIEKSNAFIHAGLPCYEGGGALAGIISGRINPSGKLSFTYPQFTGHITPYNVKAHDRYTYQFPFGAGLHYGEVMYSDLSFSDTLINRNKSIIATVKVKNTGKMPVKETVLWMIRDEFRSITPMKNSLRHFEKVALNPGETKILKFEIQPGRDLAFPDETGRQLLEDGYFELTIGGLKKRFLLSTGAANNKDGNNNAPYLQIDLTN